MTSQVTSPQAAPAASEHDRAWVIVASREIMAKVTNKGFVVSTLASLALIVGLMVFQLWFVSAGETYNVAVTDARGQAAVAASAESIAAMPGNKDRVVAVAVADRSAGLAALTSGSARALLESDAQGWTLTYQKEPSRSLDAYLGVAAKDATVAANAAKAGLSPGDLNRGTTLTTVLVEGDAARAQTAFAVGMAFSILFFMSVLGFGMQIAQSVVEEKQSRIVEILASAIPVSDLLAGKVIGNTAMALSQMVLYAATGLIGLSFTEYKGIVPTLSGAVGWFIAFFLAGFLALACVWAVAGSLASRSEDLQQTTLPLTLLLTPAYIAGMVASGTVKVVLSYVPIVSAMVMPVRLFDGTAAWWEGLLALGLNLAFAALTIGVGSRLYRASLLQVHGRVTLGQAFRAA